MAEPDIRAAWIEETVAEFGRVLPGLIILVSKKEIDDIKLVFRKTLEECWTEARRPLLEALAVQFNEH